MAEPWRPQVKIRCGVRGCRAILERVDKFPEDGHQAWTDPEWFMRVESCSKHGGIPQTIQDADQARADKGLPPVDRGHLMHVIRWSELLEPYQQSRGKRRPSDFVVMPQRRSL